MSSRRVLKAAECIRQVVSMSILVELKDPRIENVTVTFVEVSSDMRNAKVHVSVMGDESKQRLCLKGLQNSAGFLQQKINERIDTRYVPKIRFVLDQGVKNSIAVTKILEEVLPNDQADTDQADNDQADTDQADTDQADTDQADNDQADNDQADNDQADNDQADTDQADSEHANTAQPDLKQPELGKNESDEIAPDHENSGN